MENLIMFLATSFGLRLSFTPLFRNYLIGDTGCSALLPTSDKSFRASKTESGDNLYFHETEMGTVGYGLICIRLREQFELDHAMDMLTSYIHKLKLPFNVLHSIGAQESPDWNNTTSKTITDYWQDEAGTDWKVKGYTDGRTIAVLYVKNIGQADIKKQELFLDGFHFNAC